MDVEKSRQVTLVEKMRKENKLLKGGKRIRVSEPTASQL